VKSINSILNFLILGLVVIFAGVFYYLSQHVDVQSVAHVQPQIPAEKVDKVVNKYLKETMLDSSKEDLDVKKTLLAVKYRMMVFNKQKKAEEAKELAKKNSEVPLDQQIWKESDFKRQESDSQTSSNSNEMTPAEKEEYKRQYIENARRGGYNIELSDDLEVIKATPIEGASNSNTNSEEPPVIQRKPSKENDSVDQRPSN
jgi:hypothetical protein